MSPLEILDWIGELMATPGMLPMTKNVGTVIARRVNGGTGGCFPSLAKIAQDAALSPRHVRRALGELARAGFLAIEARAGHSNVFRLLTPRTQLSGVEEKPQNLPRTQLSAHPGRSCPGTPDAAVRLTNEGTSEGTKRVQPAPSGTCCAPSGEGPEDVETARPGAAAQDTPDTHVTPHRKPSTARPIAPDWQPDAASQAWITAQGVSLDDARPAVIEFRAWALDTQVKRASWDRTFRNNAPVRSALRRLRLDRQRGTHGGRPLEKATGPAYRTTVADIDRLLSPAGALA